MNAKQKSLLFSAVGALALLIAPTLLAQSFVGGVRGIVQDVTGAVIPNASVTLTNEATGTSRNTVSNSSGEYIFSQLPPATYTVSVEAPGFKKVEQKNVVVGTQQTVEVDIKLELGQMTQSVVVEAAAPLIETTNAQQGQVINTQQIEDLPNLGRNTFLLSKLSNNVVPSGPPQWNRFQDQIGSSNLSIGGGPIRANNYLVDGIPITSSQNLAIIIPAESGVQEMKLQENTYDASMGRTGGGVFNTVIKSGTNSLHGEALGYLRTTDFTANNFFNNAAGVPRPSEQWENWALSLGGPIVIPKIYNGRNKTFFFVGTEGYLEGQPASGNYSVPTAAERMGNFSAAGRIIYNPFSSRPCTPSDNCPAGATVVRDPFPNNIIPPNLINPVGQAMMNYLPLPNTNLNGKIDQNNFTGTDTLLNHAEEFIYKVEEDVSTWLRLNGSFLYYKSGEPGGNTLTTLPGSGSYLLYRHVDATALNAIMTVNPTTVVTARYGFNRFPNLYSEVSAGFNPATLGLPSSYVNGLQQKYFPTLVMTIPGTTIGGSNPSYTVYWSKNASVGVSKFIGKHSISTGFDYRRIRTDGLSYGNAAGSFSFNGIFTQQYNAGSNGTGSDYADLLLGAPSSGTVQTVTKLFFGVDYYAGFFQDDIRLTNKLTVNVGLRYEYETGEYEAYNHMLVGFNKTAVNPIASLLPPGSGVTPYGVLQYAGQNGNPSHCCNAEGTHFGPRLGFAYQINDKTTFRGGWGIFYAPVYFSLDASYAPGFTQVTTYLASTNGNATPANSLSNPFPNGILQPAGSSLGAETALGSTFSYPAENRTQGRVQQFSADIQRQLPGDIALEVGYVGARADHLQPNSTGNGWLPINQLAPQYLSLGSALTKAVPNPFYGLPNVGGVIAGSTVTQAQLLLPYPEYGAVYEAINTSKSQYDSMVMKLQKRLSKGLTFLTTFTWAKNYDNEFGSGGANYYNTFSNSSSNFLYPQNAYNLKAEWALAASEVPWRYTASWTYELPFGKGKPWLDKGRLVDYAVGGWSVNGTFIDQSGFPLFIYQPNQNSVIGALVQRPNATGISPTGSGSPESRLNSYVNPAAFSVAPQYTFGNVSRSIPNYGPGLANWDISLFKTFHVTERFSGQFRAEALNAFNTPNFANPNTNFSPGNGNFGHITYQANLPRELQLGLRFAF